MVHTTKILDIFIAQHAVSTPRPSAIPVLNMMSLKLFCLRSPATSLPNPISEARAVPYEDSFLLVGGRQNLYAGVFKENNEIYKFELDEAAPKTMSTSLMSDGTLHVYNPPKYNGSWKKLPQKTRTPRYSGEGR